MDNSNTANIIVLPAFMHCSELRLDMSKWGNAINRLPEAKNFVPSMYRDLEADFQEAWRESKLNAIKVGDAIRKVKQNIEEIKADIQLEEIPKALENLPKSANNTDFRKAIMNKNENYKKATEYLGKLEAMLEHFESHMKTMENTSSFMKKQMNYFINNRG